MSASAQYNASLQAGNATDALAVDIAAFHIHSYEEETKHALYDWKPIPVKKWQNTTLEKMHGNDTAQNIWDMLSLRDVFALSFVSHGLREQTIERAKKIKYITHRSRVILTNILADGLRGNAHDWLDIMREHYMYVGGSSILQGILFDGPAYMNCDAPGGPGPWDGHDLDMYIKTDAGFGLLKPKMDKLFEMLHERDAAYGSWFYGRWIMHHGPNGICGYPDNDGCEIDVISADNGIECYDLSVCQNSITWEGKLRCLNMYDIVHMEMKLSPLFENQLIKMISYAIAIFNQMRRKYYKVKNSCGEFEAFKPDTVLMTSNLEQMTRTLITRIKKYRDRGFAFDDKKLEALYKDEALWGYFVEMVIPIDHSDG